MATFTPTSPVDPSLISSDDYGAINDLNLAPFNIPGITSPASVPPGKNVALPPPPSTPIKTSTGSVSNTPPPSGDVPPNPAGAVDTGQTYTGTGPPPQYTPPQLQQPKYTPPKAGLEYLAAGLSLLFPQSPIARIAGGFAGGLQQGAENRYERAQQQATTTNQQNTAQAQAKYQNDLQLYQYNQGLIDRGINPQTKQPFQMPPQVAAIVAKANQPNATLTDVLAAQRAQAAFWAQVGSSTMARQYQQDAQDTIAQINEQKRLDEEWRRMQATQHDEDVRQQRGFTHADAVLDTRLQAEREIHQMPTYRDLVGLSGSGKDATVKIANARAKFSHDWRDAITAGPDPLSKLPPEEQKKLLAAGFQPGGKPAAIDAKWVPVATKMFIGIDRSADPLVEAQKAVSNLDAIAKAANLPADASTLQKLQEFMWQRASMDATARGAWSNNLQGGGSDAAGNPIPPESWETGD